MYMSLWMAFIILCIMGLWATEKLSSRALYVLYFFILLAGTFLLAARPDTIPDYLAYEKAYNIADLQHFHGFHPLSREPNVGMEYGFIYCMVAFRALFHCNFRVFLFVLVLLTLFASTTGLCSIVKDLHERNGVEKSRKYYREILLTIEVLYFSYMGLLYQGIAIRAAVAMTFGILAVMNTGRKRYILTAADIVLAFMFHRMAVIIVPLVLVYLFVPRAKNKRPYMAIFLAVTMAITAMIITGTYTIFSSIILRLAGGFLGYGSYVSAGAGTGHIGIRLILIAFTGVVFSYSDESLYKLINIFLAGVIIATVFAGIGGSERLYDYFFMFWIPVLAMELSTSDRRAVVIFPLMFIVAINYYINFSVWSIL